jgi:four helix bundle protein
VPVVNHQENTNMFIAYEVALELITALRPIVPIIQQQDSDLADQLRRAGSSVVLNLAEGNRSAKGNKQKHFAIAHGSASEVRAALQTAVAWGWIDVSMAAPAVLDRLMALLWRLRHPRRPQ